MLPSCQAARLTRAGRVERNVTITLWARSADSLLYRLTSNHKPQIHTKCQCKDQLSVHLFSLIRSEFPCVCLHVLFTGQASSRREPHTLRQELELSDHGRGYVRPL